jgi:gliding motility-associated-like protein
LNNVIFIIANSCFVTSEKKLFYLFWQVFSLNIATTNAQNCLLEKDNFDGWELSTGNFSSNISQKIFLTPRNLTPLANNKETTSGFHKIMYPTDGRDPNIIIDNIPVVPPNEKYAIRMGNISKGNTYQIAKKRFQVLPGFALFQFQFAAILRNAADHLEHQKPSISFKMLDERGNLIGCTNYDVTLKQGTELNLNFKAQGDFQYRNWSKVTTDLRNYEGQNVFFEVMVHGCIRQQHLGYMYFTADCKLSEVTREEVCDDSTKLFKFQAPEGFAKYLWSTGDTTQNILVSSKLGERFTVKVTPFNQINQSCSSIIPFEFKKTEFLNEQVFTLCEKDSVFFNGTFHKNTSVQKYRKSLSRFCDSVFVAHIKVNPNNYKTHNKTICVGETFAFKNKSYTTDGTYTVVEKFSNKCDSILTLNLKTVPVPKNTLNFSICQNDKVTVGNKILQDAGTYTINVPRVNICDSIITANIVVENNFKLTAPTTSKIALGFEQTLVVRANPPGYYEYDWSPKSYLNCYNCPSVTAKPLDNITYQVRVNKPGSNCFQTTEIQVFNDCGVFLPSVFSPNGDGTNDVFRIEKSPCVSLVNELVVYNRWGQTIFRLTNFKPSDPQNEWDGTFNGRILDSDTFAYKVVSTLITGEVVKKQGAIALVR